MVNEGGKLFLTSKEEISVHAIQRSDMLQSLQATAGHTQALPFGRAAFENWMKTDPIRWLRPERPWPDILQNIQARSADYGPAEHSVRSLAHPFCDVADEAAL